MNNEQSYKSSELFYDIFRIETGHRALIFQFKRIDKIKKLKSVEITLKKFSKYFPLVKKFKHYNELFGITNEVINRRDLYQLMREYVLGKQFLKYDNFDPIKTLDSDINCDPISNTDFSDMLLCRESKEMKLFDILSNILIDKKNFEINKFELFDILIDERVFDMRVKNIIYEKNNSDRPNLKYYRNRIFNSSTKKQKIELIKLISENWS